MAKSPNRPQPVKASPKNIGIANDAAADFASLQKKPPKPTRLK